MEELRVDGLFNVRGTDAHAPWLIRSGAPEGLTAAGAAQLRELGVSVIVDLREPTEAGARSHGIPVVVVPLYGSAPPSTGQLESIYEGLLRDRGTALALAVTAIAQGDGAALVHCTAGKDRTGLVVALARLAAGDSEQSVIDDYALSGPHVYDARVGHAMAIAAGAPDAERADILRLHLDSPREAIAHALTVIDEYGGAVEYLRAHGLEIGMIDALREKSGVRA